MTGAPSASPRGAEAGPPPDPGAEVWIDGVPDGPWPSVVVARGGDTLTLAAPRRGGVPAGVPSGETFLLCYAVRAVPCEVDAAWVEGPVAIAGEPIAVARMLGAPRRLQRRAAVRVPVRVIVRARPADGAGPASEAAAITENLSAGGALLRMGAPLAAGRPVRLTLQPPGDPDALLLDCRVLRCDRAAGRRPWRVALAFSGPAAADERRLVRWLFRLQREARALETGMGR